MTKNILIIDDNEKNRRLVGDILAFHGYRVRTAADGETGLDMAEKESPDLILLDIQMPAMDGFAVLAALKKKTAATMTRVIAMTALAMRGDRERIIAAGFDGYLAKPFNTRELPVMVAQEIGKKEIS